MATATAYKIYIGSSSHYNNDSTNESVTKYSVKVTAFQQIVTDTS